MKNKRLILKAIIACGALVSSVAVHAQDKKDLIGNSLDSISKDIKMMELLNSLIPYQEGEEIKEGDPVPGSLNGAINLPQGWTEASQQEFYFTSQGSRILPYSWYLHLEQARNENLFRSDDNIRRFAYIPSGKSKSNPDGLSIGFAKDLDASGQAWMGLTCAACHTTEVQYQGTTLRIDGGPTMGDFETFNIDLVAALQSTLENENKFQRFAHNVLENHYSSTSSKHLRGELAQRTAILKNRNKINRPHPSQPQYGYARVDAIGAIFNQVMSVFDDAPNSARPSNAPVSYPFLWGTHQSNVVQWTGFAPNGPLSLGALIRNGGEVLGVYGQIDIGDDSHKPAYPSSLDFQGLGLLEARVAQLKSPPWPSSLPPIDQSQLASGQQLYSDQCASCHQVVAPADQGQSYKANLTPIAEIQTDSQEILNLLEYRDAGTYAGRKELGVFGPEIGYLTTGLNPLISDVVGAILAQPKSAIAAAFVQYEGGQLAKDPKNGIGLTITEKLKFEGEILLKLGTLKKAYDALKGMADHCEKDPNSKEKCAKDLHTLEKLLKEGKALKDILSELKNAKASDQQQELQAEKSSGEVYKGRPLNGIWATAPYLHNGSVLNLWELLLPAKDRMHEFYVGNRELDTVNVGFVNSNAGHSFLFDTTLLGNSNSGHEYGVNLSKAEKMALIEYMKTL